MAGPVLDMTLAPKQDAEEPRPMTAPASETEMLIQAAQNPHMDPAKLSQLIDMRERVLKIQAEAAFDEAFSAMQAEIPVVVAHARGDKWMYAPLEDILEQVRPILARHGFSLSHETEWPDKGTVLVVGILAHRQGHKRRSKFMSAADTSGSKNAVQALGSAVQYGRRYTTNDLLCIATRSEDDDAKRTARNATVEPDGYEEWLEILTDKATEGLDALQAMWRNANADQKTKRFAEYLTKTAPGTWNTLKVQAAKIKGAK